MYNDKSENVLYGCIKPINEVFDMGFRKDFIWGTATASFQIEGAWNEDGKGESVWDRFCHEGGHVLANDTGDVACDHYHRYKDDLKLMADLGVKNYRFSVAWPRILPEGKGEVNEKGLAFYDSLIDEMLKYGIKPYMTIFHWDYPMALQACGAWENPDSSKWFADYVDIVSKRYGDRVKDFITLNEPQCFIGMGYCRGEHAPGLKMMNSSIMPMVHNTLLAHGKAVQVLRANVADCRVGYAPCGNVAIPETNSAADIEAARRFYFSGPDGNMPWWPFNVALWSDPAILGRYPEGTDPKLMAALPKGWEAGMKTICQPLDFYCQNIYNGTVIRAANNAAGFEMAPEKQGRAKTAIQWSIHPEALYWGPKFLYERYKLPFFISENGMSAHDWVALDGKVHDPNRQDYMHRFISAYRKAAEDGVDARGYFAWSFMDNFEWAQGYDDRFGLVYVDYQTQQRTPKDSMLWYKQVMETNGENL